MSVEGGHVVKAAESDAERERLGREVRCLRACAHPGVVALLGTGGGDPPDRLFLALGRCGTLADAGRLPVEAVAGLGAALAATLADLHDLGWVHGAVQPNHVLLDERGGPVLCGFGRAAGPGAAPAGGPQPDPARDVAALAAMLLERLPRHADRRLIRVLTAAGGRRRWGRPVGARHLAAQIVGAVPGARLEPPGPPGQLGDGQVGDAGSAAAPVEDPEVPAGRRRWLGSRRRIAMAGGGALLALTIAVATWLGAGTRPGAGAAVRPPAGAAGRSPAGLDASGRYLLSDPAGRRLVSVIGRWGCGRDRPAVLDPATGWVWVFGGWPAPGRTVAARAVAHRPGASGLAVEVAGAGCDALVVLANGGRPYTVPAASVEAGS